MERKYKSINEEINRIKSLFTEERMFGNLITEASTEVKIPTGITPPGEVSGKCVAGDCKNGEGTWKDVDFEYVGGYVDGKRSGKGTYKNSFGEIYVGEFKDDMMDGKGTFTQEDGTVTSGTFKNDSLVTPDKSNVVSTVETFKDIGGKYSYSKLPDGTYWYSTDGSNWKKQTSQNGMDAIEGRITSDRVESLGKVEISSIDSSYKGGESNQGKKEKEKVDAVDKISNDNTTVEKGSDGKAKEKVKDVIGKVKEKVKGAVGKVKEKVKGSVVEPEEVAVDESDVTFKGCKKRITSYIKLAKDGTSMKDAFGDKVGEKTKDIQGCLGKYYNRFEKIGFMKKGKGVYLLKRFWDIDYEKNIDGGIEGEKYDIMVNNRSRGKVKRIGKNEYRVISKPDETIFGRDKNFRDGFEEAVFNSLDLPSEKNDLIVAGIIQKGPVQWAKLLRKDI